MFIKCTKIDPGCSINDEVVNYYEEEIYLNIEHIIYFKVEKGKHIISTIFTKDSIIAILGDLSDNMKIPID